jgi:phage/plasmid-like protein (TIGR03299 family)
MAHRLSFNSGKAEMAYTGEVPWHGYGTKVDGLQSSHAMLAAAGMVNWNVELRPMFLKDGFEVQSHRAIVRKDIGSVLGVATPKYNPIQNEQAADVNDAVLIEGKALVEVAGALDGGERCWMLSHIPEDFEVVKGDLLKPYFLLAWGHDGKHGLAGKLTTVRVVCNNTLTAAGFGAKGVRWKEAADFFVKHNGTAKLRIEEARTALGVVRKQLAATIETYKAFAGTSITESQAAEYFTTIFPEPSRPEVAAAMSGYEERIGRWNESQSQLAELYVGGKGASLAQGTVWNAYNAVTEWTDHVYPVLQNGNVSKTRQQSVLFGSYANVKSAAFSEALALVN